MDNHPRACVLGCSGQDLTDEEREFFRRLNPLGFILFAHNCDSFYQVRTLISELRKSVGRPDAPILIDQEGGRVQRLGPPNWRSAPAPATFARLAERDMGVALEAAEVNARLLAHDLEELGITVDCAPVLDVPQPDADPIIGDRASGGTPELAERLGRAACDGFLAGGVAPVIKHIPGHGRATADSHKALPVVDTPRADLEAVDFAPFKALADMPWAMTAHVVYSAVDPEQPATTSKAVIDDVIRGHIGFDGLLISDDLAMEALTGSLPERAERALAAGCDVALYCNTEKKPLSAVEEVAEACGPLTDVAAERFARAEAMRSHRRFFDSVSAQMRLDSLLEGEA